MDLIDRQALLKQIDIDSDGEPGYYGDTWKFIDTIKRMPSALSTNLAEVGRDAINRDAVKELLNNNGLPYHINPVLWKELNDLPPAQPEIKQQAINSSDCIDRRAALDALRVMQTYKLFAGDDMLLIDQAGAQTELMLLPSVQPEIIRCKDCKHWIPYDWMFSEIWQSKNIADYPEDEIGCDCCDMAMKANDFCSRAVRREVAT